MTQVFLAIGECHEHDCTYIYPFINPDEAKKFIELVETHDDDAVTYWHIMTETAGTAETKYYRHRKWVEE
jgi:hypothetical protein